jgi:hypothetical protein
LSLHSNQNSLPGYNCKYHSPLSVAIIKYLKFGNLKRKKDLFWLTILEGEGTRTQHCYLLSSW